MCPGQIATRVLHRPTATKPTPMSTAATALQSSCSCPRIPAMSCGTSLQNLAFLKERKSTKTRKKIDLILNGTASAVSFSSTLYWLTQSNFFDSQDCSLLKMTEQCSLLFSRICSRLWNILPRICDFTSLSIDFMFWILSNFRIIFVAQRFVAKR